MCLIPPTLSFSTRMLIPFRFPTTSLRNRISQSLVARGKSTKLRSSEIGDSKTSDTVHVNFETSAGEKTISVQKGEVLRTAMLKRGISPHNGKSRLINCRGLGTCGTCAVEVRAAFDNSGSDKNASLKTAILPSDRNARENLRLNFPPHGSNDQSSHLRLACQIQINEDVNVKKRSGFWGQDPSELADEYDAELYFGELEFVLDQRSPSEKNKVE